MDGCLRMPHACFRKRMSVYDPDLVFGWVSVRKISRKSYPACALRTCLLLCCLGFLGKAVDLIMALRVGAPYLVFSIESCSKECCSIESCSMEYCSGESSSRGLANPPVAPMTMKITKTMCLILVAGWGPSFSMMDDCSLSCGGLFF